MNIFIREIKAHRKSLVIWIISLMFLIMSGMSEYSAFSKSEGGLDEMLNNMPESLQKLFGFGTLDFSLGVHYYGALYLYIALLVAFHAVTLGSGIISKEERDRTAEFLLTKPISRFKILTYKIFATLAMIVIFNLANFVFTLTTLLNYAKGQNYLKDLINLSISLLVMQLVFMSIGLLSASVIGNHKRSSAVCSSIILTMFILAIIVDMLPGTDFLKWFTVFQYYDSKDILTGEFGLAFLVISMVIILGSVTCTYYFYKKRDINV